MAAGAGRDGELAAPDKELNSNGRLGPSMDRYAER